MKRLNLFVPILAAAAALFAGAVSAADEEDILARFDRELLTVMSGFAEARESAVSSAFRQDYLNSFNKFAKDANTLQGIITELTEFDDPDPDRLRKLRKFFGRFGYEPLEADCSIAGVRDNLYVKPLKSDADLSPVIHRVLPDFYTRFMPVSAVWRMLDVKAGKTE